MGSATRLVPAGRLAYAAAEKVLRGLYAIVDTHALEQRGLDPLGFVERVLAAGPAAVQLRAKRSSPRGTLELLRAMRPACERAGVPLYANDRPDLAVAAGCDGVHVGQDDLSVEEVRRFAPDLAVGVSTHDREQLERALAAGPDYVAFGPVFVTTTKDEPDPVVGLDRLAVMSEVCRKVGRPLVAIGGVTLERAPRVAKVVEAAAAIGALLPPEDAEDPLAEVEARARALAEALGGGR